jgi:hypothetical protein
VDKAYVVSQLHEITDHYLLGEGSWPADRESVPAFFRTVRSLGLDENVLDRPGATRSTALGRELELDLIMAFAGVWEIWEIPYILADYGYIEESQAEELCTTGTLAEAERKLGWYVLQAYLQFCNHKHPFH